MFKPIIAALLIASCVHTEPTFPTNTEAERQWKQEYSDGKITWSEYQERLKLEKEHPSGAEGDK